MVEVSDNERGDTGDWMPRGDTGATAGGGGRSAESYEDAGQTHRVQTNDHELRAAKEAEQAAEAAGREAGRAAGRNGRAAADRAYSACLAAEEAAERAYRAAEAFEQMAAAHPAGLLTAGHHWMAAALRKRAAALRKRAAALRAAEEATRSHPQL